MSADPIRITSLKRPPEGWEPPAARAARTKWIVTPYRDNHPKQHDGARADAEPADALRTLTPGINVLPVRCPHCGSMDLQQEPALGQHPRGMLTCQTCSRQVCWLTPAIPLQRAVTTSEGPPETPQRPHAVTTRVIVSTIDGRLQRLEACGLACSVLYGHDPATHEAYGYAAARSAFETPAAVGVIVRTGPLAVDIDALQVWVNGEEVHLPPFPAKLLVHLARHVGRLCPYDQIVRDVWDDRTAAAWGTYGDRRYHSLRTPMTRLRAALGTARAMVETREGLGYCLRDEPPVAAAAVP